MTSVAVTGDERDGGRYAVRAVDRVIDIFNALSSAPAGLDLQGVAEEAGLPKSSVFRYLATLEARGYVTRDPQSERFSLGAAVIGLRSVGISALGDLARPVLRSVRDAVGETTNLGIFDGTGVAYVEVLESSQTHRIAARVGDREVLHASALGKCIAGQLDEETVRHVLQRTGMPPRTPHTITDLDAFLEVVRTSRERGWGVDEEEVDVGGRCLAVPLLGLDAPAAISVSAPTTRLTADRIDEVIDALHLAARRIQRHFARPQDER